eukprot:363824-Chlamydomonas_euryale.AAC.8
MMMSGKKCKSCVQKPVEQCYITSKSAFGQPGRSDEVIMLFCHIKDNDVKEKKNRKGEGSRKEERSQRPGRGTGKLGGKKGQLQASYNMQACVPTARKATALKLRFAALGLLELRPQRCTLQLLVCRQHIAQRNAGAPQPAPL